MRIISKAVMKTTCNTQLYFKMKGKRKMQKLINFFKDEKGASGVEYGLLVALIAAIIVGTVQTLGQKVLGGFTTVNGALP